MTNWPNSLDSGLKTEGATCYIEWALQVPVSIKNLKIRRCQRWCSEFRREPGTRGTRANSSPDNVYEKSLKMVILTNFQQWNKENSKGKWDLTGYWSTLVYVWTCVAITVLRNKENSISKEVIGISLKYTAGVRQSSKVSHACYKKIRVLLWLAEWWYRAVGRSENLGVPVVIRRA